MQYVELCSGTSALEMAEIALYEQDLPEGQRCELRMRFESDVSLLSSLANQLNQRLLSSSVGKWPEQDDYVYVDPYEPVVVVKWRKGQIWAAIIIAATAAIFFAIVALVYYRFYKAIYEKYPWLLPVLVIGGIAIMVMYAPSLNTMLEKKKP